MRQLQGKKGHAVGLVQGPINADWAPTPSGIWQQIRPPGQTTGRGRCILV